jgi:hypothetical protein
MQHIETRSGEGVSAVATTVLNKTDLALIETLGTDNNFTQYEEVGSETSGYSTDRNLRRITVLIVDDDEAVLEDMIDNFNG